MSGNLTLILVAGVLVAAGVYLMTERSLSRILMGVLVLGNGVNVLFLVAAGPAGRAPIIGLTAPAAMTDPMPQALVLTAIVIGLAAAAFVMAMAFRSFQLNNHDEVPDDIEDARIRALAEQEGASVSFEEIRFSDTGEDVVSE